MQQPFYTSHQAFKRPFVQDLAFALACPTVITDWQSANPSHHQTNIHVHSSAFWQTQFNAYQHRLTQLDTSKDYQQLTRFLMIRPSPHRLGFHFEGLVLFWLQDGFKLGLHPFEVVAHNVQMTEHDGKHTRTLGELDLIIFNHDTLEVEHWELAIKFYLGSYPFAPINWVGINSKDNLQRKMTHMSEKPFTHNKVEIKEIRFDIDKRYAVIKGRFFVPFVDTSINSINTAIKPMKQAFIQPNWLTDSFPLHTWYTPEQAQAILIKSADKRIRKSHYVEWFTPRPFYNTVESLQLPTELSAINQAKTGLYFLYNPTNKKARPMVIHNR